MHTYGRLSAALGACLAIAAPGGSLARSEDPVVERVSCTAAGANAAACRVDQPDIRVPERVYDMVRLEPGDRVTFRGSGCAQTGGRGLTWKRYVDPKGDNADHLYYGVVWVEGAMAEPTALRDLTGPVTVTTAQPLRAGYVDDAYDDNGYHKRDCSIKIGKFTVPCRGDGNPVQCAGEGPAVLTVHIERLGNTGVPLPAFGPTVVVAPAVETIATPVPVVAAGTDAATDADGDGIPDATELALAERYAPTTYHAANEPNLQTTVEDFLTRTRLGVYDSVCAPDTLSWLPGVVSEVMLPRYQYPSRCVWRGSITSGGTRSSEKQQTFVLDDVQPADRRGSIDPARWVTYVHSYPNTLGGVTLQYWRFYAYNTGQVVGFPDLPGPLHAELGFHGGDWEGIHVVLGADRKPVEVHYLGHTDIVRRPWASVPHPNDHPAVLVNPGGHSSEPFTAASEAGYIRHDSWTGGRVRWAANPADGAVGGGLVPLGERTRPTRAFLAYSGLWGAPGVNFVRQYPALMQKGLHNFSSGYWGPAFNETEMRADGFATAWCDGMASGMLDPGRECIAPRRR